MGVCRDILPYLPFGSAVTYPLTFLSGQHVLALHNSLSCGFVPPPPPHPPAQVAQELQDKPPGSALFRPAMKPTLAERLSHISASIKLADLPTGENDAHTAGEGGLQLQTEVLILRHGYQADVRSPNPARGSVMLYGA
jgi:hypothetical protein